MRFVGKLLVSRVPLSRSASSFASRPTCIRRMPEIATGNCFYYSTKPGDRGGYLRQLLSILWPVNRPPKPPDDLLPLFSEVQDEASPPSIARDDGLLQRLIQIGEERDEVRKESFSKQLEDMYRQMEKKERRSPNSFLDFYERSWRHMYGDTIALTLLYFAETQPRAYLLSDDSKSVLKDPRVVRILNGLAAKMTTCSFEGLQASLEGMSALRVPLGHTAWDAWMGVARRQLDTTQPNDIFILAYQFGMAHLPKMGSETRAMSSDVARFNDFLETLIDKAVDSLDAASLDIPFDTATRLAWVLVLRKAKTPRFFDAYFSLMREYSPKGSKLDAEIIWRFATVLANFRNNDPTLFAIVSLHAVQYTDLYTIEALVKIADAMGKLQPELEAKHKDFNEAVLLGRIVNRIRSEGRELSLNNLSRFLNEVVSPVFLTRAESAADVLATLHFKPPPDVLSGWLQQIMRDARLASPSELLMVVRALARMDAQDTMGYTISRAECVRRLSQFTDAQLMTLFDEMEKARQRCERLHIRAIDLLCQRQGDTTKPVPFLLVHDLLWCSAWLNVNVSDHVGLDKLMSSLLPAIERRELSADQMVRVAWAAAVFGRANSDIVRAVAKNVSTDVSTSKYSLSLMAQVYKSHYLLKAKSDEALVEGHVASIFRQALEDTMRAESEAKGELIEDVARILGRAGFLNGAARNMKLGGGNRSSKGYVLDFARNYVAFQVVFADSTWGAEGLLPMGRTALMEQHLGGDWRIHFISEQLWAELTTDEKKLDFINEKLRLST